MRSPFYFIAKPVNGRRYDNTKEIGGVDFIVSTSEEDHKFSNRFAEVVELPLGYKGPIKEGDTLLVQQLARYRKTLFLEMLQTLYQANRQDYLMQG